MILFENLNIIRNVIKIKTDEVFFLRLCLEALDTKAVKTGSCSYFVRNSCAEPPFALGKEPPSVKRLLVLRMCKTCGRRGTFSDCGTWLSRTWS